MNVLIVEDSEPVYQRLRVMLSDIPGVKLAGHEVDEQGAIKAVDLLLPDIVILDLLLNEGSGYKVLSYAKKRHPAIRVMVLSNYSGDPYIGLCKQLGADYILDKSFQFELVGEVLELMGSCGDLFEWDDHTLQQSPGKCASKREAV